ncbi:hypothetical protein EJ06DRAFT_517600 [Trichodelitschia bisporula]|uniref:SH3 domain-containing protein n=1 Tax=Trichodelitschia bisporula TaxID=703511 RepID=A0A6G1HIB3_9PEZI|nr:hypothetical protein EJ06DRAFT_517600 [Trichodelitschia bisporula]
MAVSPFKVKAIYAYTSEHEDDLPFEVGQIITVTEEEDAEWYIGEFTAGGTFHSGLFPKNFVERYEPAPPPRPVRAPRPKPVDPPSAATEPPAVATPKSEHADPVPSVSSPPVRESTPEKPAASPELPASKPSESPEPAPKAVSSPEPVPKLPSPTKPKVASVVETRPPPAQAPPPTESNPAAASPTEARPPPAKVFPVVESKPKPPVEKKEMAKSPPGKAPPPVAEKPSSFRDRIAAFNKTSAPPIAPFKPSGLATTNFIKKPFVAPPPARNAYVPPPREPPPQKLYRRDEDPEIAERRAQDQENAEKAGMAAEEDAPKMSLKERIAALQKQQAEQAARRTETTHKEKPKRPPKKRLESHDTDASARGSFDADEPPRESLDTRRPPKTPDVAPREREIFSDANDADQSAAGETTEDAEGSTGVEDEEHKEHKPAPAVQPDVGEEEDSTEGEGEDEMDEETRRQLAIRERMAKLSGGMGLAGVFGPPGGIPMPGVAGNYKKKPPKPSSKEEEPPPPQQRVPMIPIPGMGRPVSPTSEATVTKEESAYDGPSDEIGELEDLIPTSPSRTEGPPLPGDKPTPKLPSRPTSMAEVPPPPAVRSPSPGSVSDDEASAAPGAFPLDSPTPTEEKRPPVPITSPPMSPTQARPPPPPPPAAPPHRHSLTKEALQRRIVGTNAGESEYEGDYDTDIASGAKHKDALKAHAREASLDDSITTEDLPIRGPPPLPPTLPPVTSPTLPRAVPPPPPAPTTQPRKSGEAPRPPIPRDAAEDDEYDPYRYAGPGAAPPAPPTPSAPPPLPASSSRPPAPRRAPTAPVPPIPAPAAQQDSPSDDDDDLYAAPPPRRSTDRPPPPPAPSGPPPKHGAPPPPISLQSPTATAPPPPPGRPRPSVDDSRPERPSFAGPPPRMSSDVGRAPTDTGYIAHDVDLARSSLWWTQPNTPPPVFSGRKDVLFEMEESTSSKRGGKTTIAKDVYVLFQDYSQTVISVRYDARNPSDATLDQRHEPPPPKARQDQLEAAHEQYGSRIAEDVQKLHNTVVGDGTPQALITELLKPLSTALSPVGTRAYGALVYANMGNASVQQWDEIRAGDIISFRNAKFQGKHGTMHAKYTAEVGKPDHVGVVAEWDGTKKKVRAWDQGRESRKVKSEGFRLGDLRSGEVRVWRVVGRGWVGWEGEA